MGRRVSAARLPIARREIKDDPDISYLKTIKPRTEKQEIYLKAIDLVPIVFGIGAAGSGKTLLAAYKAAEYYDKSYINRVILVRPAVASEDLGYLPGDLQEKIDPYMKPLYDALRDRWGARKLESMLNSGEVEVCPLAFLRGVTFHNAFIILDEAQNTTIDQMRMFLTRFGDNIHCVITGDLDQSDLRVNNGLQWAATKLNKCTNVEIINFTKQDVVRSELVKDILRFIE